MIQELSNNLDKVYEKITAVTKVLKQARKQLEEMKSRKNWLEKKRRDKAE